MTVNLHGISRESFDLIVEEEVSGRATYEKKYVHPEKPGGQSGVTVGIGYDCGYSSAATIHKDWDSKIPAAMVEALAKCAGIKGDAAFAACNRVRAIVSVPWEAAIDVFSNVSIPKYMAATRKALPGYDNLASDCKGVLLSLTYNRGASYTISPAKDPQGRYSEMRAIRAAVISGDLAKIPGLLRAMKRLWTAKSVRGVATRREHEARLFERGLATRRAAVLQEPAEEPVEHDEEGTAPFPTADAAPVAPAPVAIDTEVVGDSDLYSAQKRLKGRHYSPGMLDGEWGSGISGALSGFRNDSGMTFPMPGSLEEFYGIKDELAAMLQLWEDTDKFRPVTEARKSGDAATVATVAPEVVPAKQGRTLTAWGAFCATMAGLYKSFSDTLAGWWDFLFDHKDDIPTDPSLLQTAWGWLTGLPSEVWIFGGAIGLIFVTIRLHSAIKQINEGVTTGARQ